MKYVLGIDVGITSVGWSLLNLDKERIESLGVRTFPAAENPNDGSSLALPRRLARGMRRRIQRRSRRLEKLRNLLIYSNLLTADELKTLYQKAFDKDPYELRFEGLERLLNPEEWARVLIHITKHRGFKSNRKSELAEPKSDSSKLLSGVERNRQILINKGYRTVGEMFYKDKVFIEHKRNKAGEYLNTISRDMLEDEIHILFQQQRKFSNQFASESIEEKYISIFSSQRPYMTKALMESMVGKCTFEKDEKRAPKYSYTSERFVLLSKVNSLYLIRDGNPIELSLEQKQKIISLAYKNSEVKYKQIRKVLELNPSKDIFKGLYYGGSKDPEEACFVKLKGFHMLKKAFNNIVDGEKLLKESDRIDKIAEILTYNKMDTEIRDEMNNAGFSNEITEAVLSLNFNKVQHLSIKAMKKLLPFLEEGLRYGESCNKVGYVFYRPNQGVKNTLLPEIPTEDIKNPVVIRALSQTRKIINEIIRKYGSPYRVHIELARNITKPKDERKKIEKEQDKFKQEKDRLSKEFLELHHREPSGLDLLKYRLWKEQNGFCLYCQKYLEPERIFDPGYADIDHIIPYSRSFDDSMSNKVLVCSEQNRMKSSRTPYEFIGGDSKHWEEFLAFVNNTIHNGSKKQKLLQVKLNENEMKSRHLNDTRYISRFLSIFIEDNLKFTDDNEKSKRVLAVNGQITAFLRAKWGLIKIREEGDLHHALDATVIASATPSMIQAISMFSQARELYAVKIKDSYVDPLTGEKLDNPYLNTNGEKFPLPWDQFRNELLARLSKDDPVSEIRQYKISKYDDIIDSITPVFISRKPTRKVVGKAHKETIFSPKYIEEGFAVVKKPLTDIKLESLENMFGKERDYKLYEGLKKRLEMFNGDPQKAFVEPFYKATNDGSQGPIVRSIKIMESKSTGVYVNGGKGIAGNDSIIRTDVFLKNKKYYMIPIYVAHRVQEILPNRAIVAGKPEKEWELIDSTFTFCFSLYPNDLVRVELKNEEYFGYYCNCDRATGSIKIEAHDRSWSKKSIGVKTAINFQKYQVDLLGKYYLVKEESRLELA